MDNDEVRDWAERMIRQVRDRTKSLCLRRNSPFITSELILNTEQTKFLIQACYKHKIGVYINTDPNTVSIIGMI